MTASRLALSLSATLVLLLALAACGDDDGGPPAVSFGDGGSGEGGGRDLGLPPRNDMGTQPPTDGGREGGIDPSGRCSGNGECALGRRLRACCDCLIPLSQAEIDADACTVGVDEEYTDDQRFACRPDRSRCVGTCDCPTWVGVACNEGFCTAYGNGTCRFDSECGTDQRCVDRNGDGLSECISVHDFCDGPQDCGMDETCRDFDGDLVNTCGPADACVLDEECDSGSTGPCVGGVCIGRMTDAGPVDAGPGPMVTRCGADADCTAAGLEGYVCGDLEGDGMRECIPDPTPCGGCPPRAICTDLGGGPLCVPT